MKEIIIMFAAKVDETCDLSVSGLPIDWLGDLASREGFLHSVPGSLVVMDAPRVEARDTGGFAIHPFAGGDPDDADIGIYDGRLVWASYGGMSPQQADQFAAALHIAAGLAEKENR